MTTPQPAPHSRETHTAQPAPLGERTCNRRLFLLGSAATFAGAVLAACGGDKSKADSLQVEASEVPLGSAVVVGDFIVAQPTEGKYVAYSALCTHQGVPVTSIDGDTLTCPAHGSQFSAADGSVLRGPARDPLEPATLKAEGNTLEVS